MNQSEITIDTLHRGTPDDTDVIDTSTGPLVGNGRLRRLAPFALTSSLSVIIATATTSWVRPWLAVAGLAALATTIVGAAIFPWRRAPRLWQLAPPVLCLIASGLMIAATGTHFGSPFLTTVIVPLTWLAIYESRWTVISIGTLTGLALWLLVPVSVTTAQTPATASLAVFVICAVGMGGNLQELVSDNRRVTGALREQREALEHAAIMLDALPDHVSRFRVRDHVITYCNATWADQYLTTQRAAIGRRLDDFLSEDEAAGLASQLARLGPQTPILKDSAARSVAHNPTQWIQWIDRYLVGPDGDEILSIGRDVSDRRKAEIELAHSETRFRDLADKSADVVWRLVMEPTPHFDYMSPSVETIVGYPPSYFLADFGRMLDILDDPSRAAIGRAIERKQVLEQFDFRFRHANGSIVIAETRATPLRGGLQGVSRDVTELRRLQADVVQLALRDPLTGLANRRLLEELLSAELARTERNGLPLAVAFLDLDGLKHINDTYGHDVGDIVLRETADRLRDVVRSADTVARIGGDEFVIVYEPNDADSQKLTDRVEWALSVPIEISPTTTAFCRASIGIATTDIVGYDSAGLLAEADRAMYDMKRARYSESLSGRS